MRTLLRPLPSPARRLVLAAALLAPAPCLAAVARPQGLAVRAGGETHVRADEQIEALVVVGGDAHVAGEVGSLLLIGGAADLEPGARVGDLTVAFGHAVLGPGAAVTGDVRLVGSALTRAPDAQIGGSVPRWGLFPFGLAFTFGAGLTLLTGGLVFAALAPGLLGAAQRLVLDEPGRTFVAALIAWMVVPVVAIFSLWTVIGIPLGAGLLLVGLPALGLLGYLVAGAALGERVLLREGNTPPRRLDLLAPLLGVAILLVLGVVPIFGALLAALATTFGSGALVLLAWRALRSRASRPAPPAAPPLPSPAPG